MAALQARAGAERSAPPGPVVEGRTLFLSSHNLPEVERSCDRVGIIREGRLIEVGPMQALLGEHWRSVNLILGETPDPRVFELPDMQLVSISDRDIHLMVRGDVNPLIRRLGQLELRDIAITTPDIEDVFLRFYGPSTASGPIAPAEPQQAEEAIS